MHDKNFHVVGKMVSADGVYTTLYLLQKEESTKYNNERTNGRLALNIPMKTDPTYIYNIGDEVRVGFSMKYKKFYVVKEGGKNS